MKKNDIKKMIKKNKKTIMRGAGTCLLALALILSLNLAFNKGVKIDKKYVGVWKIGYNFYSGNTADKNDLLYTFTQELYLEKDGTFYTKEMKDKYKTDNFVFGTFETNEDRVLLKYTQGGKEKTNILNLKDDKLCLNSNCSAYYTLDKIETYFPMYNSKVEEKEA